MPVVGLAEFRMDSGVLEKSFTIESRTSSVVEGMVGGGAEGGDQINSLQSSFHSRSQNGTIHDGRNRLDVSDRASDSSKSHNGGVCSEAEGGSGQLNCNSRDREIVKGITYSEDFRNKSYSGNSSDNAPSSEESNLTVSSEAGVIIVKNTKNGYVTEAETESGAKTCGDNAFGNESKKTGEERRRSSSRTASAEMDSESEKLWKLQDKMVFEGRTSAGSYHPDNLNVVGGANFDTSQAGGCLEDRTSEAYRNGENAQRNSDAGVSSDGRFSERSFGSATRHDEHHYHHRHSRGSGAGIPNPALVERLYNPPHICNHVRCAANNPDYAVKQETPPKKYLVAKTYPYGGVLDRARRKSCDHEGGSTERTRMCCCDHDGGSAEKARSASCDHDRVLSGKARTSSGYSAGSAEKPRRVSCDRDKSHALHVVNNTTEANGDKPRRDSVNGDRSQAINTTASGNSRRSSVDSDRSHAVSGSSGVSRHRRGKSTPIGLAPQGPWNSSVALDNNKKQGDRGLWSSVIVEKKHGNHGARNNSTAVDKKQTDYYYGPWNGSVAIEKKSGEKKEKPRTSFPGSGKQSSKGELLQTSRRTSTEIIEDRRQKPRRSSIASDVSEAAAEVTSCSRMAEETSGSATARVPLLSEEGRSPLRTTTQRSGYYGSPSASVGSNHSDNSCSKDSVSWKRRQSSPESSCAPGGDSPSGESFSSVTRGSGSKADSKVRYEQPTMSSKLPRFPSSYSPPQYLSASVNGKLPGLKPSRTSSTSISKSPTSVACRTDTSILAKNFLAKLKESTRTATPSVTTKAPALPSWNSSITVAPNLFDYSTNGSPALKMTKNNRSRKSAEGAERQMDETLKSENPTPPEDTVSIPPKNNTVAVLEEMSVPIPESSAEKHIDPGSVVSVPSTPSSNLSRYGSMSDSATSTPSPTKLSKTPSTKEREESEVPATVKFGKKGRTTRVEETLKNETVNLKKNETPERRLSEEYMTDHTLTTTVKRDIQGGRVKSLVHAFESLKTGLDAEHHHSADETVRSEYERELAAEFAALPTTASPTPV